MSSVSKGMKYRMVVVVVVKQHPEVVWSPGENGKEWDAKQGKVDAIGVRGELPTKWKRTEVCKD